MNMDKTNAIVPTGELQVLTEKGNADIRKKIYIKKIIIIITNFLHVPQMCGKDD